MFAYPPTAVDVVKLLARIGIGIVFVAHGWQKLFTLGMDATTAGFRAMGVPLPGLSAWLATLIELVGGILLIIGLAVPIAGTLLFLNMLGAYFLVHIGKGLFVNDGGGELVIALGLGSLLLAAVGAGRYSIDHAIAASRPHTPSTSSTGYPGTTTRHRGPDTIP